LLKDVRALLAAHERVGDFLRIDSPGAARLATEIERLQPEESSDESRSEMLEERSERLEADKETPVDESLAGLSYAFNLTGVYDCTDRLVERFRYEFVKP
jgi:hypothetical protein